MSFWRAFTVDDLVGMFIIALDKLQRLLGKVLDVLVIVVVQRREDGFYREAHYSYHGRSGGAQYRCELL